MDPNIRKKIKAELFNQDKDLAVYLETQEMNEKLEKLINKDKDITIELEIV